MWPRRPANFRSDSSKFAYWEYLMPQVVHNCKPLEMHNFILFLLKKCSFFQLWHFHGIELRGMRFKVLNLTVNHLSCTVCNIDFEDVTDITLQDNILWKFLLFSIPLVYSILVHSYFQSRSISKFQSNYKIIPGALLEC